MPRPGDDAGEALDTLRAAGRKEVWVTPQVPLLAFIALGYGLVNVFGSPLGWLG